MLKSHTKVYISAGKTEIQKLLILLQYNAISVPGPVILIKYALKTLGGNSIFMYI